MDIFLQVPEIEVLEDRIKSGEIQEDITKRLWLCEVRSRMQF
jgi:hypothetical protein